MEKTKEEYLHIKHQLELKGVTLTSIADEFAISKEMVRLAIYGRRTSDLSALIVEHVEEIINKEEGR